jgi:hypothetical protein
MKKKRTFTDFFNIYILLAIYIEYKFGKYKICFIKTWKC